MKYTLLLAAMLVSAIGAPIESQAEEKSMLQQMIPESVQLPVGGDAPSLSGAVEWLNSQPLAAASLRGKVVSSMFGPIPASTWLRTLPHVPAWAEKYENRVWS